MSHRILITSKHSSTTLFHIITTPYYSIHIYKTKFEIVNNLQEEMLEIQNKALIVNHSIKFNKRLMTLSNRIFNNTGPKNKLE